MSEKDAVVKLVVAGAVGRDIGKGLARMSQEACTELGIQSGDAIEIYGKRMTAAIALPAYAEDQNVAIVRLDGLQRSNAGVSMGETVEVRRAEARIAKRVSLAPAQKNIRLMGSGEQLRHLLYQRPLVAGDIISTSVYRSPDDLDPGSTAQEFFRRMLQQPSYGLQEIRLAVTGTNPRGAVQVGEETVIELSPQYVEPEESWTTDVTYDDIGGMGASVEQVREMIELPLRHPEIFQRLGIESPKGILLHGPPGTGKTLLARAVAHEADARFFYVAGPEIVGRYYGESEQKLRDLFAQAQQNAPAIIFFDELDSLAPKREQASGEMERRIVAQLLTLMDGLEPRQNIVVIGATNRVNAIDEALRRPGRFDREIVVGIPDQNGRYEILQIHTRGMPLAAEIDLKQFSRMTHGFVGADLAALCREAAMETLRRNLHRINLAGGGEIASDVLADLSVTHDDFSNALKRVEPSALREIMIQIPDVRWQDLGGVEGPIQLLREGVELPLKRPEAFQRIGIRPAKGFLLFGPPGTGKTLLAKAVARESEANFIAVKSSDLLSKWYGESEQQISRLFGRARQVAPTVIFIDEIDSLAPQRGGGIGEPAVTERVVNTLLSEMDGLEDSAGIVVIGATNRPNLLDSALLRPGRFDELIYVPIPDEAGRLQILKIYSADMPLAENVSLQSLAEQTSGYSGADLEDVVRRAGLLALRSNLDVQNVSMSFFDQALKERRPSVTPEMLQEYEEIKRSLRQESPRGRRIGFVVSQDRH